MAFGIISIESHRRGKIEIGMIDILKNRIEIDEKCSLLTSMVGGIFTINLLSLVVSNVVKRSEGRSRHIKFEIITCIIRSYLNTYYIQA